MVKVNKDLLPMKAHYFLFNGGVSPVQPFMPVIAKDLKFPSNAVGIINGILPFTGMLAKPLFGAIADRFKLHKFIFIFFQILTIIGFFSIHFLTGIEEDNGGRVKLVCGAETNFDICFKGSDKQCLIQDVLKESFLNKTVECALRCDLSSELRTELCGQWKANPSVCTQEIIQDPNVPEYVHTSKGNIEVSNASDSDKYLSGNLDGVKLEFVAKVPLYHTLKFRNCLYFRVTDAQLDDETHHIPFYPWILVFLVWCIILGMCVGVQWTFLFWHVENLSGTCEYESSKKTILGLASGVQCFLGELPSFFLFGWILKKLGHVNIMTLVPFVIGIRFFMYSILPNPWWVLPIEVLQCSVGLGFATMASYASTIAPPGAEATVQGLVGAIFEGIGVSLGSYFGGLLFKDNNGSGLFQIFGCIAFALSITHGSVHYLLGKNKKLLNQTKVKICIKLLALKKLVVY
ncbi:hypothetical protein Phum_PHUM564870 [Pediculus humanus corporis]|uniref:Major facilitator superfamily associated domain-containing protein n=1 Tax=Pediculus humanus subsp. corporis TaxID=121224 RepID=E0W0X5_PEDHC|nr:uncharacterized protein Phum_PHUM564870 [Pediculus humanus corporis]EEB19281.1 hypothetical protein Phum_PHUM564870 [Pediculus humanus corporis]